MSLINDALKRAKKQTKARPRPAPKSHETLEPVGEHSWTPQSQVPARQKSGGTPWPWIVAALLSLGLCLAIAGWFFGSALAMLRSEPSPSGNSSPTNPEANVSSNSIESASSAQPTVAESVSSTVSGEEKSTDASDTSDAPKTVENKPLPDGSVDNPNESPISSGGNENQSREDISTTQSAQSAKSEILDTQVAQVTPDPESIPEEVAPPKVYLSKIPAEGGWPELRLQGIFYDADDPVALINNRDLLAGETIGKIRVISIESKKVLLQLGSERKILQFRR